MTTRLLYLFTRTPLHVGAGSSVGAIDQPIVRERHTGFPIIPGSALKGVFADSWTDRIAAGRQEGGDARWLFGSDEANNSAAGALQFSEARLLSFPVRSAKGSFAWLTSPLALARAARDLVPGLKAFNTEFAAIFTGDKADEKALFSKPTLGLGDKVVLEEYTFTHAGDAHAAVLNAAAEAFAALVANDPVWAQIAQRLVIVSDGMLSFFAKNACEVAQHVSIDDATGTAAEGKLFNQENVPSETLFYSVVTCFDGRGEFAKGKSAAKTADAAGAAFDAKLTAANYVFQFGGDASTGLGFCTVRLGPAEAAATNANAA